jgi:hypothetical protein
VVERRYQAVMAVIGDGLSVSQVAEKVGVSRQPERAYVGSSDGGNRLVAQRFFDVAPIVGLVVGQHARFDFGCPLIEPSLRVVAQRPVTRVTLCGRGLAACTPKVLWRRKLPTIRTSLKPSAPTPARSPNLFSMGRRR